MPVSVSAVRVPALNGSHATHAATAAAMKLPWVSIDVWFAERMTQVTVIHPSKAGKATSSQAPLLA